MDNNLKNHWLVKLYLELPLWAKIVAPLGALFIISALFRMLKFAFVLALIGAGIYVVLGLVRGFGGKSPK